MTQHIWVDTNSTVTILLESFGPLKLKLLFSLKSSIACHPFKVCHRRFVQLSSSRHIKLLHTICLFDLLATYQEKHCVTFGKQSVSYTHLTLPTKLEV